MGKKPQKQRTWTEEIEVAADDLVGRVKELAQDASVTRLIIRKPDGQTMLEVPIAAGAAVAGALTFMAPVLAALGAMAALVANFKVDIVRSENGGGESKD